MIEKNYHSHFQTPRSDSHALVINTSRFQVWCYACDDDIAENSSKKLLEAVQMVKKLEKKEPNIENAKNLILAGFQNVAACSSEVSVEANIKLKSPASTASASLTFDKKEIDSPEILPRVRGLTNLGNTCFFNAMMQCLSQTPFLYDILNETNNVEDFELPGGKMELKDKQEKELNPIRGTLKGGAEFIQVLTKALEELQTKSGGVFTPNQLLRQFTTKWPQFAGGDQHDSHEALRHLLESVRSEDLRRYQAVILNEMGYNKSVNPSKVDEDNRAVIKFYGNQASERILCPEPVFRGFLVSTLTCQECGNISPRQETFLDISLPVISDKPHPPSTRRKTSPDPVEKYGPTKSQLKKEKKAAVKAKRNAKHQNRKTASSNASNEQDEKDESDKNRVSSSESDADVEDSIDDSQSSKLDPNGNKVELSSPQNSEKKDDMPENPFKEPNNVVCVASLSANGIASLTNQISKKCNIEDGGEPEQQIDDDEKTKAIKHQQQIRQGQQRTRQTSFADWSNTLGPRYQCASDNELSIQSCLNHFMSVEYMMGNNKVGCDACTERQNGKGGKTVYTNATKQFLISSPPAVLILHLKRFQVGMRGMFR